MPSSSVGHTTEPLAPLLLLLSATPAKKVTANSGLVCWTTTTESTTLYEVEKSWSWSLMASAHSTVINAVRLSVLNTRYVHKWRDRRRKHSAAIFRMDGGKETRALQSTRFLFLHLRCHSLLFRWWWCDLALVSSALTKSSSVQQPQKTKTTTTDKALAQERLRTVLLQEDRDGDDSSSSSNRRR